MTLRLSRTLLGTSSLERECGDFRMPLRRATVPAEAVPEHSHETAHVILAIDENYLSDAAGASSWRGPSMLAYNPPGTVHRDRYAAHAGRFVSIDLPSGFEPGGIIDATVVRSGRTRTLTLSVVAGLLGDLPALDMEDRLLLMTGALSPPRQKGRALPPWLELAAEAIGDLAGNAELRVRDIARIAGVHPVHLARAFKEHFRCSPGHAIRRIRVERVAAELSKRRPMADLSLAHGFADQPHMARCFREFYGTTPSAFRAAFD